MKTSKETRIYINRRDRRYRETVDEFPTRKEAREMLQEYRTGDRAGAYWISARPCKGWNN